MGSEHDDSSMPRADTVWSIYYQLRKAQRAVDYAQAFPEIPTDPSKRARYMRSMIQSLAVFTRNLADVFLVGAASHRQRDMQADRVEALLAELRVLVPRAEAVLDGLRAEFDTGKL